MTTAVKFVDEANWIIEGLILPYGGGLPDGNDLTGSHFTKSTDFCEDWFPNGGRPGLYAHGFDPDLGTSVVAREIKSWKTGKGGWLQAQIDKAHEYADEIKQLVNDGKLHLSSGAVDHLVSIKAKTGEIERWPFVEFSLVTNPANPEAIAYSIKSADAVAHLAVVATDVPDEVKADEPVGGPVAPSETILVREAGPEVIELPEAIALRSVKDAFPVDPSSIQHIHDAAALLGADCSGAGKASDTPPANVLAIRAGDVAETVVPVDLAAVKQRMTEEAIARAREIVGS